MRHRAVGLPSDVPDVCGIERLGARRPGPLPHRRRHQRGVSHLREGRPEDHPGHCVRPPPPRQPHVSKMLPKESLPVSISSSFVRRVGISIGATTAMLTMSSIASSANLYTVTPLFDAPPMPATRKGNHAIPEHLQDGGDRPSP